jgi:hypothetical protein
MATETLPAQMTDEELVLHAFSVLARELVLLATPAFSACSVRDAVTIRRSAMSVWLT